MKRANTSNPMRAALLVLACALGVMALPVARAADEAAVKLTGIDVQTLAGKQVQLTMHLNGAAPAPLAFTIDKPARISFDLPNTGIDMASHRIDVGSAGVDSIVAVEANGRSRVVLNMAQLLPYQSRVQGNDIIVLVGTAGAGGASSVAAAAMPRPAAAPAGGRSIKSIDFRRGENGAGRLIVKLSDTATPINLSQQGSQVVVSFAGTDLPQKLTRRYDASDFGTPVSGFDTMRAGNDARIVINTSGEFEQLAYQSDDQYVVEVQKPRKNAAATANDKPVYSGEKLSLDFQDIDVRAVLQIIADTSGQNIVVKDSVTGSMTLHLKSVPWDQVLDIVLKTRALDKRQEGNVIIVAPAAELAEQEKADLAAKKDLADLSPVRTDNLVVNYAKASDMAALLRGGSAGSGASAGGGGSVLSARGSVSVDERTNTLLITDTSDRLMEIRRLISTLDIPVRQVLIEARIVVVNDDFERDLGVRAGLTGVHKNGSDGLFTTSGSAESTDLALSSALDNLQSTGSVFPVKTPTGSSASNRYNVNLPVTNPAGRLAFMLLGSDYIVDLELSAAQAEGRGKIISQPSLRVGNQQEATIEQGVEIPYQQSASSGAATIQFKKAVLSLTVKPLITPDNRVILDVSVTKDSVGKVIVTSGGVNVPSIDTRKISTQQVLVNDGQTVVLGGILETEERESLTKVPFLGDIPVLGHLFKNTGRVNNQAELLIFVTPKILREGVVSN